MKHKFIRADKITDATTHDSQWIANILPTTPKGCRAAYADSASRSAKIAGMLSARGHHDRIQRKATHAGSLSERSVEANRKKSKVRAG